MKKGLKVGPLPTSMAIPGCNSGKFRGGMSGICEQRENDGSCMNMRGCSDSPFMKAYEDHDIIMADSYSNTCNVLYKTIGDITHDATIVGLGRSGIVEFWLVK
jgi:hypothetical protein